MALAAREVGYEVMILPLESMTLYEQMKAFRQITVLIGIHGSGLNNALFLNRNTVLLQILTYNLRYKGAFEQTAKQNHVSYLEMMSSKEAATFHWDFVGEDTLRKVGGKEAYLAQGSPSTSSVATYTFWINQDIILDLDAFKVQLFQARRLGLNSILSGYS